jgi:2'-5' RNA ligase
MEYNIINISIQPPKDVCDLAIEFAKKFPDKGGKFSLARNDKPHITLYYAGFPRNNVKVIVEEQNKILIKQKALVLNFDRIKLSKEYLSIEFKNTTLIKNLHISILKNLNLLRQGYLREKYLSNSPDYLNLKPANQNIVKKWGHPYVAQAFKPHISILGFDSSDKSDTIDVTKLNWSIDRFISKEIVVYWQDKINTPFKVIAKFKLQIE